MVQLVAAVERQQGLVRNCHKTVFEVAPRKAVAWLDTDLVPLESWVFVAALPCWLALGPQLFVHLGSIEKIYYCINLNTQNFKAFPCSDKNRNLRIGKAQRQDRFREENAVSWGSTQSMNWGKNTILHKKFFFRVFSACYCLILWIDNYCIVFVTSNSPQIERLCVHCPLYRWAFTFKLKTFVRKYSTSTTWQKEFHVHEPAILSQQISKLAASFATSNQLQGW